MNNTSSAIMDFATLSLLQQAIDSKLQPWTGEGMFLRYNSLEAIGKKVSVAKLVGLPFIIELLPMSVQKQTQIENTVKVKA